ncbi:hypothetical protein Hanom_Chr11g01035301 [Helianthus anomalus]
MFFRVIVPHNIQEKTPFDGRYIKVRIPTHNSSVLLLLLVVYCEIRSFSI